MCVRVCVCVCVHMYSFRWLYLDHCTRFGYLSHLAKIYVLAERVCVDVGVPCFVSDIVLLKFECFHGPVSLLMFFCRELPFIR